MTEHTSVTKPVHGHHPMDPERKSRWILWDSDSGMKMELLCLWFCISHGRANGGSSPGKEAAGAWPAPRTCPAKPCSCAATATAVSPALLLCCCCCFLSPRCQHGCPLRAVCRAEHPLGCIRVCVYPCVYPCPCVYPWDVSRCVCAQPQPLRPPELLVSPPRWLRPRVSPARAAGLQGGAG